MGNCLANATVESELPWPADGAAGTGERAAKQETQMDHSMQLSRSEEWIIVITDGVKVLSKPADTMCRKKPGKRNGEG